jgi:hypothetical protein
VAATQVRAVLAPTDDPESLRVELGEVAWAPGDALEARRARASVARPKVDVGPIDLTLFARGSALEIGVGPDLASTPLKLVADLDARRAELRVARAKASSIAAWLGHEPERAGRPWPGAFDVEGTVALEWPEDPAGDVTGRAELAAYGLSLPLPSEVQGFASGDALRAKTSLRARPGHDAIELTGLEVSTGSLRLAGRGSVVPRGDGFRALASVDGRIPCADLASSMAAARLGILGVGLGALARGAVGGFVEVHADVEIDSDRIDRPTVAPRAAIGCSLRLL